jgi:hypothetical protein
MLNPTGSSASDSVACVLPASVGNKDLSTQDELLRKPICSIGFVVYMAVKIKSVFFCDMIACSFVGDYAINISEVPVASIFRHFYPEN